ncbi:3'-5' exonuclease [Acinetobacter pragensis]|uniref:3'-5' exonuclease n=1 Tax=Acinetobacter pragensis TaxID=1806892 RepID=UPI00333EA609
MAELIPPSIQQLRSASSGERKVYQLLEHVFQDENAIIWHEPKALNRYTDFIVWLPNHGLLVVEVKDWSKDRFETLNPETFTGRFYNKNNAQSILVSNPELQVRKCMLNILNQFKKTAVFLQQRGPYQGNVKFPISSCVIYTELKQQEASEIGLSFPAISSEHKTIYKDDLRLVAENKTFKQKLIHAFKEVAFAFEPLTYAEEKFLRYMIFPEIRVNEFKQDDLFTVEPQEVKALDLSQESIAKNIGDGHRILKGVAGSGKTLVLACRAKYLKTIYPDYKILVVCYNNSLCNHLRQMFGDDFNDKIEVLNFHSVVKKITNANLSMLKNEKQTEYNSRVGQILLDYLDASGLSETERYDAILIDEGQDFAQEWIIGLSKLVKTESNNILFCYDPAQNIFNRKKPSWRSVGLQVQGKKPVELYKCYRNTKEILEIAKAFLNPKQLDSLQNNDEYDRVLDPDTGECKTGEYPSIYHENDVRHLADLIARKIRQLLKSGATPKEIVALQAKSAEYDIFVNELKSKLESYIPHVEVELIFSTAEKKALDLNKNTIKIMNVESSKGLEFPHVFFVGLDHMPRLGENRDLDSERKLAYVGMTRAQNKLFILGCENKGFLADVKAIYEQTAAQQEPEESSVQVSIEKAVDELESAESETDSDSMIGQKWTEDEEVRLIDAFMDEKLPIKEIAQRHNRKIGGIRARLKKLRLID